MVIGHLDVTTWQGISIGATHWYCDLTVEENNKKVEDIELKRPIGAAEAAALNKEDKANGLLGSYHKRGNMTTGFMTKEAAIKAGVDYFKSKYKGILFDSGYASCSAWKKAIIFPEAVSLLVKEMNDLADKFQALNGYEGNNQKLVTKLDNQWYKLYLKLEELCKPS